MMGLSQFIVFEDAVTMVTARASIDIRKYVSKLLNIHLQIQKLTEKLYLNLFSKWNSDRDRIWLKGQIDMMF